jgi:hypothetical protein
MQECSEGPLRQKWLGYRKEMGKDLPHQCSEHHYKLLYLHHFSPGSEASVGDSQRRLAFFASSGVHGSKDRFVSEPSAVLAFTERVLSLSNALRYAGTFAAVMGCTLSTMKVTKPELSVMWALLTTMSA